MNYKYHLLKYSGPSSRLTCPNCGAKHSFAPYVDANDQIVGKEYGRCNHESSCGYVRYPPSERDWRESYSEYRKRTAKPQKRVVTRPQPKPEPEGGICTIPMDLVLKTVRTNPLSDFLYYLCNLFDVDTIMHLVSEYLIGVTRSGDTIFYQIDQQGRCRTGKIMKYDRETGHRIKDQVTKGAITWVHSILKQQGKLPRDWQLTQCLFGEHLLKKYPDKPVCLVEAEKTAVICSAIMPQFVWVAVGGKTQLGDKVEVLYGRTIVAFPDVDGYDAWVEKISERPYLNIQVSRYLADKATDEDKQMGADIADVLIRWILNRKSRLEPQEQGKPPAVLYADNPVMQEVMKYISPEYWDEVDALIKDFDLELVSVTRLPK
jgi:hypothetical protein